MRIGVGLKKRHRYRRKIGSSAAHLAKGYFAEQSLLPLLLLRSNAAILTKYRRSTRVMQTHHKDDASPFSFPMPF